MRRFRDPFVTGASRWPRGRIRRSALDLALRRRRRADHGGRDRPDLALAPALCHTSPEPARETRHKCLISPRCRGQAPPPSEPPLDPDHRHRRAGPLLRRSRAPPLRDGRHRVPARAHLLRPALPGAARPPRPGRRGRGPRRHPLRPPVARPPLRALPQPAASSRSSTPPARTSRSSRPRPASCPSPSSTPRSRPWSAATATRSATRPSSARSPRRRSTSPPASPTGAAGRSRPRRWPMRWPTSPTCAGSTRCWRSGSPRPAASPGSRRSSPS